MHEPIQRERVAQTQRPTYASDRALAVAVERALSTAAISNDRRFNDCAVTVHEGRVLLRGHVMRSPMKKQVAQVATQTRGGEQAVTGVGQMRTVAHLQC